MPNTYRGKYSILDMTKVKTYSVQKRQSRVNFSDVIKPQDVSIDFFSIPDETKEKINILAEEIVLARNTCKPVILFTGAHLVKNGMGPLLIDLVNRKIITLIAGNGATSIHDFELALFGETSENTSQALREHRFGMAFEFGYINQAIILGNKLKLGFGESLGMLICDESFRKEALSPLFKDVKDLNLLEFLYPEISIAANCFMKDIPFTVHASIGTDVIDQHMNFDGEAKGGCSARDFLIYSKEISKLTKGGVVLNIGSSVTGPEVFLKAAAIASNVGCVPCSIITADFDIRQERLDKMSDESSEYYYFRDQKSVVTRIPQAFDGKGCYIQGNQKQTLPYLYKRIIENLDKLKNSDSPKNI